MKKKVFSVLMLVSVVYSAAGQPPPPPPPPQGVSLDVVVALLIITGLVYGTRRLMQRKSSPKA